MRAFVIFVISCAALLLDCTPQKDYVVTINTKYGPIKVILYDQTPKHKQNFLKLAREGKYDSTTFHRIIKDFMIQGGDVNAKPGNENEIDYTIPAEFVDTLIHHRGALAAARMGDQVNPARESNGCQFYIVEGQVFDKEDLTLDFDKINADLKHWAEVPGYDSLLENLQAVYRNNGPKAYNDSLKKLVPAMEKRFDKDYSKPYDPRRLKVYTTMGGAPHLDDTYTVFGRVVEGMDVVDKIASVKTAGPANKPVDDIYITMDVEEINKDTWNKRYGELPY